MQSYKTENLLSDLYQQTCELRDEVENTWKNLSPEAMHSSPAPGKWNALECIAHLNSYGRYYLPEIEKALAAGYPTPGVQQDEFTPGWLGDYFTRSMRPKADGSLKKMRAPKAHAPSANQEANMLFHEFSQQQGKFLQLLERAKMVDLNKVRVPISIARFIRLKLGDVFMFILVHNQRHIMQGRKAIEGHTVVRRMSA